MKQLGKKKTVWFSQEQLTVLKKIMEIAPREVNTSSAIREGLKLYLKALEQSQHPKKGL